MKLIIISRNTAFRLHNEKIHSLYRSPNTVRVIKSRRLRWAGHVAGMEEGNLQEKDFWGCLGVVRRTILEWILKRYVSMRGNSVDSAQDRIIGDPL